MWQEARMPKITAITIQFNGAEYLELMDGCATTGARSLPQYVRFRCGLPAAMVANARSPAEPRRSPVRLALERRSITISVDEDERSELDAGARAAATTIPQYIRTRCGFLKRNTSLPGTDERGNEEDDAQERLKRLGLNPDAYFEG